MIKVGYTFLWGENFDRPSKVVGLDVTSTSSRIKWKCTYHGPDEDECTYVVWYQTRILTFKPISNEEYNLRTMK
jgi:hypothetical protein